MICEGSSCIRSSGPRQRGPHSRTLPKGESERGTRGIGAGEPGQEAFGQGEAVEAARPGLRGRAYWGDSTIKATSNAVYLLTRKRPWSTSKMWQSSKLHRSGSLSCRAKAEYCEMLSAGSIEILEDFVRVRSCQPSRGFIIMRSYL